MTWRTRDGLRAVVRAKGIHSIMAAVPATPSLRTGYLTRALDKAARSNYYKRAVTIVYPVRTAASQAAKTGSNPVGDAKRTKSIVIRLMGRVPMLLFFFSPTRALCGAGSSRPKRAFCRFYPNDPQFYQQSFSYPKNIACGMPISLPSSVGYHGGFLHVR